MKKWIAIALCLCTLLACTACNTENKENKSQIVGKWIAPGVDATAEFKEDGTGYVEFNGRQNLTWTYDANKDRYIVTGEDTAEAAFNMESGMEHLSYKGVDFYRHNDYDKAHGLIVNKYAADIANYVSGMTKLELNKKYDLSTGVTIEFTEIAQHASNKGMTISYIVTNNGSEAINEPLKSVSVGKGYFADQAAAADLGKEFVWAESLAAGDSAEDLLVLMYHEYIQGTLNRHEKVYGAIYFEFSGQKYYIDLSECLE